MFYPYSLFPTLIVAMSRQKTECFIKTIPEHGGGSIVAITSTPAPTLLTCFDTNMGKRSLMQFFVVEFCEL